MLEQLLKGVFDEGIRQWIIAIYNNHISNGLTSEQAKEYTEKFADKTFGNWKVK